MSLSRLLVLTDRSMCDGPLVTIVATAIHYGARTLVLREKDLPDVERDELAGEFERLLNPVGGTLIRAGAGPATALHLAAADPFPSPRPTIVGRSCHDSGEISQARTEGCDYITVSPVFLTASKPGYGPALGLAGLADLIAATNQPTPPVYALGGITPGDVAGCLSAGAYGVAVMGPVMRNPALVAEYLTAIPQKVVNP